MLSYGLMEGSTRFAKLAQVLIQDSNSMGFASATAGISNFEFGLSNSRSADGIFDADDNYSLMDSLPVTELSG